MDVQIAVPPLSVRAALGSVDVESRTVELVFSTGADVPRYDYRRGEGYIERLSMKPEHIRMERINASAPLLNTHSAYTLSDQIGVVVPGSARIKSKQGLAKVRFSSRADVEPIFQDVVDEIVKNVSCGYRVYRLEELDEEIGGLPVRLATDWEPAEVSMVPMPADIGAQTRSEDKNLTNPCVLVTREITKMADEQQTEKSEYLDTRAVADAEAAGRLTIDTPQEPNERDAGAAQERERSLGIMQAVRAARLPQSFGLDLITKNVPLVRAQSLVFAELAKRDDPTGKPDEISTRGRVEVGDDPVIHERAGIENALLHRVNPRAFKLDDKGRKYRGMTLLETARTFLNARGQRTTDLSKNEIAGMALGLNVRTGYHTTSDFSTLLANTASRALREEYNLAPQTFMPFSRRITLSDYKPTVRMDIGEAPALLRVEEHGEYTHGTIGQGSETMQLAKYGRKFAITREAIINDDTDAFSRIPMKFGRAARNLESNLVWLQIISNPVMGDGVVLFHADHDNLASVAAAITVTSVGIGRKAMRLQTARDSDGVTYLDIAPRFLIVPPAIETVADMFVTPIGSGATEDVNPFGGRLQVISEPRLETGIGAISGSATAWYLAAEGTSLVEYAYLEGEEGPAVESRVGFDVDGLEIKCRLDFAAKVMDWKAIYKNAGA